MLSHSNFPPEVILHTVGFRMDVIPAGSTIAGSCATHYISHEWVVWVGLRHEELNGGEDSGDV